MPSPSKKSYGLHVQARGRCLLQALLEGVTGERELERGIILQGLWSENEKTVTIETTLRSLVLLNQPELTANTKEFERAKAQTGESLSDLRDFVGILDDHRVQKRGSDRWRFSLRLWGKDTARNLAEFDKLWESKRSPYLKPKPISERRPKSPLKPGAPFPRVQLPGNFVERPDALKAVKEKLLVESDQTLVVTAIAGLGGLGKSVLAMALVLDAEVQARFADGILWVTLGQHPNLQTMLGDWIRELDKSRESYSATTLESAESASRYLDSLLAERQMLLVVDDVWNAAHAEWFRVGGSGCRVLVTTREAQIEGANYHPLDLMSEKEAIALVRQKLKRQWRSEHEAEVKAFVRVVGYLPLALDLAANQVRDGLSWAELRAEFEAERRSVALGTGRRSSALKLLDSSEAWEHLDENERRKYSLQACFNLSLKRLNSEQLQQFAWLGILPEDVSLSGQAAAMLWDLPLLQAKKVLLLLRNRSLLTDGVATINSERTYRVHDLIHDVARSLVEEGILISEPPPFSFSALEQAHSQFLERYRDHATDKRWDQLPNDGYIHHHLTWHMEQANWAEEIHTLMAMEDVHGRSAWFEVCDQLGHPAIFVQDVATAWRLAEELYEQEPEKSVVLQVRYALTLATLKSLNHISPELLSAIVEHDLWSVERAWVFVESIDDDWSKASALAALIPYLSKSLLEEAVKMTEAMVHEEEQAKCFVSLAKLLPELLPRAYNAIQKIQGVQDFYKRAELLIDLSEEYQNLFDEALEQANEIPDTYLKAIVLIKILPKKNELFEEILQLAEGLTQGNYDSLSLAEQQLHRDDQASIFSKLLNYKPSLLNIALTAARQTPYRDRQASILTSLVQHDKTFLDEALASIKNLPAGYVKSLLLTELTKIDLNFLPDALAAAQQIADEFEQALLLTALVEYIPELLDEAVEKSRQVQDPYKQAFSLSNLLSQSSAIFDEALTAARRVEDEHMRASVLINLSEQATSSNQRIELLEEALDAAACSQWEHITGYILRDLSMQELPEHLVERTIQIAKSIQDPVEKAKTLFALSKYDSSMTQEVLELTNLIDNQHKLAHEQPDYALRMQYEHFLLILSLAQKSNELFLEAEESMQKIEDPSYHALALCELAKNRPGFCEQALEAINQIQALFARADALSSLFLHCPNSLLPKVWEAINSIPSITHRASVYSLLLKLLPMEETSFSDWTFCLHLLASRRRAALMEDLVTLYPAILHLGGETALHHTVEAMREVCSQWK